MATSKFHHRQLISLSEKLHGEVKTIGQDVLNQINDLIDKDTCILLKMINRVVGDTFNVIGDLQEIVIRSTEEKRAQTVSELFEKSVVHIKDVVQKLNQYCIEMVKEYNSSFSTLKQKFLLFVENIITEAECLLNLIKIDDFHDYKHQLVENLKEILFSIHITQVTIQIENYTTQEINDESADMQKEFRDYIVKIEKQSLEVLNNLFIHIRHIVKHNHRAIYYLQNAVSNFDDAVIQRKILETTHLMNITTTTFLVDSEKCDSVEEISATIKNASIYCSVEELIHFIHHRIENKIVPGYLMDLAMYLKIHCIVVNQQIGKILNMLL